MDRSPEQWIRLSAQLQAGSADFNKRLPAYGVHHVAMRTALDHAITTSFEAQYPNAPQFAHNQHGSLPSPFNSQIMPQQQSPESDQSNAYSPQNTESTPQLMQPKPLHAQRSTMLKTKQEDRAYQMRAPSKQQQQPFQNMNGCPSINPLSLSLSPESQMLLESALDPNDPMTAMAMAGTEHLPMPSSYNSSSELKPQSLHYSYDSVNMTIAPGALDKSPSQKNHSHLQPTISVAPSPSTVLRLGFSGQMPNFSKPNGVKSATGSRIFTPNIDCGWDDYFGSSSGSDDTI